MHHVVEAAMPTIAVLCAQWDSLWSKLASGSPAVLEV